MAPSALLLLLALASGAWASHYYGGSMTFTPKGMNPDGSFRVDFRYKEAYHACYQWNSWYCSSGNCGTQNRFEIGAVDRSATGSNWCQSEGFITRNISINRPFQMRKTGCCWIYNSISNSGGWRLLAHVDLGIRSDTQEPNRSPVTTIPPFIRVPQNCRRTYNLVAHDPDGDQVRCRYGAAYGTECNYCNQHSGFQLDKNSCTLTYVSSSSLNAHAFEIVLEDYPRQHITLTYTDGTTSVKSPLLARRHKRSWYWGYTPANPPTQTTHPWWYWGHHQSPTPSPWWWNHQYSTPSPWWWNQPHTTPPTQTTHPWWYWGHHQGPTPSPQWGNHQYSTPSPWWWNQPHTTPPTQTTHPWWYWGHHQGPTPSPQWGNHQYSTPSSWWWNQPHTTPPTQTTHPWWYWWHHQGPTPSPQWGNHQYSTPSPWWWNQPHTTPPTQTTHPWWYWGHHQGPTPPSTPTTTEATTTIPSTIPRWPSTETTAIPTTPSHGLQTGPLSKIPLQFSIRIDPAVSSCAEGLILPQFLSPTPTNGDLLTSFVNEELEIRLKATATQSSVNNFIISGPLNITKYITDNGTFADAVIWWTPTENDFGERIPICFIAESVSGSRVYHSEMRCVIVTVGHSFGEANVICTENTMTVEVEKSSIIGLHEDHLRLNDASCTLTSNGTHVIATMSLNSCGTQLEESAENLIFKNEITSYDKATDIITRKHHVEIGFSCVYPKKGKASLEFRTHKIPYVFTEKGFGKFTYEFEFFHSNLFHIMMDPRAYPIEVALNEMIYMEIKATSSLSNTEIFVESCRATPIDDPNYHTFYDIIDNGCVVDDTVVVFSSDQSTYHFGMEAFKFIGQHEEVYISCSVVLCMAGNPNTRCSQGCRNATASPAVHHHHRRAASAETSTHYISQGPLRLKMAANQPVSTVGLNMNLVFIAGTILLAVAMVCAVVIYRAKGSKIKYQPLPSTDF